MSFQLCEAFSLMGDLAGALGVRSIKDLPGCWEHQVDGHWKIYVNGHREPINTTTGVEVKPYQCYVEFNGWVAAFFGPSGGEFVAGALANENTFCDAMKAAIALAETPEEK